MSDEFDNAKKEAFQGMLESGICPRCRSFKSCLKRIDGLTLPAARGVGGVNPSIRFYVVLVLFLFALLFSLSLFADITCELASGGSGDRQIYCHVTDSWSGTVWIPPCSDDDDDDDDDGDDSCAEDCLNMSVAEMQQFKTDSLALINDISSDIYLFRFDISNCLDTAQSLIHAPDGLTYYTGNLNRYAEFTNYEDTVISRVPVTNLVRIAYDNSITFNTSGNNFNKFAYRAGCWNGALAYSTDVSLEASSLSRQLEGSLQRLSTVQSNIDELKSSINALPAEPCPSGNCDDSGVTPDGSYDWCTAEQGEAIISLLGDIFSWLNEDLRTFVARIDGNIKRLLDSFNNFSFSSYYAIPKELYSSSYTNKNWKTYYLSGGDDDGARDFGYDRSNILHRIELLLYGMSGVSEDDSESLQDNSNNYSNYIDTVNNSFESISDSYLDDISSNVDNVLSAFTSFFSAFSGLRGRDLSASDVFIPSAEVRVGNESVTVPSFNFGDSDSVSIFNSFIDVSRAFCTILYLLAAAFVFWHYWIWFASWAVRFSKWACEILGNLFAAF